jgi:hypothetical protein
MTSEINSRSFLLNKASLTLISDSFVNYPSLVRCLILVIYFKLTFS